MAARKKKRASTSRRAKPGRYRGLYLHVTRRATTKAKKKLDAGQVILAVGDPGDDGWVPVLVGGRLDHVQRADVERIVPKVAKPTALQQAARKRIARRAGVKVSAKEAERIRSQWGR